MCPPLLNTLGRLRGTNFIGAFALGTCLVALAGCSGGGSTSLPPTGALTSPDPSSPLETLTYEDDPTVELGSHGESRSHASFVVRAPQSVAPASEPTAVPESYLLAYDPSDPDGNTFPPGGVITSAHVFEIDVNKSSSYYGDMGTFWRAMSGSSEIHVIDQYVNATADDRYPYGGSFEVKKVPTNAMTLSTLAKILAPHVKDGEGFNAIYNIYLPLGANLSTPDNTLVPQGTACAFHGAMDVKVKGKTHHFIYAVHSYPGSSSFCDDPTFVHSLVTDTNANDTIHEVAEAITDPNVGYNNELSWEDVNFNGEVADLCQGNGVQRYTLADGSAYFLQSLFSNLTHACTYSV